MRRTWLIYAVVAGLIAGVALDVLAYWTARAGPAGDGWSLRGNGALVIPLGVGPAVLAGAWTAIILRSRGSAQWRGLGVGAAAIGALPALASVLMLVAFGRSGQSASDLLTIPAFAWPVLAALVAAVIPLRGVAPVRNAPAIGALACLGVTIALVVGFAATELVLSPGSS